MASIRELFFDGGSLRTSDLHDPLFHQAAPAWLDLEADRPEQLVVAACLAFGLDAASGSHDVGILTLGCRVLAAVARHVGVDLCEDELNYWTNGDLDGQGNELHDFVDAFAAAFGQLHGDRQRFALHL